MIEAVGLGVISGLLTAGMQRLSVDGIRRLLRLQDIHKSLQSRTNEEDQLLNTALKDLETVLGSYKGDLDTQLKKFLDILKTSGIAQKMLEDAIGSDGKVNNNTHTENLFTELYNIHIGHDATSAHQLYISITKSLFISFSSLIPNKALLKYLSTKFEKVQKNINIKSSTIDIDGANAEEIIYEICKSTMQKNKYINIETNRGSKNIEISKIFTPSSISHWREDKMVSISSVAQGGFYQQRANFPPHNQTTQTSPPSQYFQHETEYSFTDLKDNFNKSVILGDPGGGKSTTCQQICYSIAKDQINNFENKRVLKNNKYYGNLRLPIIITIRRYEQYLIQNQNIDIISYISSEIKN